MATNDAELEVARSPPHVVALSCWDQADVIPPGLLAPSLEGPLPNHGTSRRRQAPNPSAASPSTTASSRSGSAVATPDTRSAPASVTEADAACAGPAVPRRREMWGA